MGLILDNDVVDADAAAQRLFHRGGGQHVAFVRGREVRHRAFDGGGALAVGDQA